MDWYSRIIDSIKLIFSTRIAVGLFITSGVLLFFDKYFPFLQEITNQYKPLIAIIFIFTAAIIICDILTLLYNYLYHNFVEKIETWLLKRKIYALNNSEKAILREFFIQSKDEIKLPINDFHVSKLIMKGILSLSSPGYVDNLPVGIIRYVEIDYNAKILLNFKAIGWPESKPTMKELEFIDENRPQFIKVISSNSPMDTWVR